MLPEKIAEVREWVGKAEEIKITDYCSRSVRRWGEFGILSVMSDV